MVRDLCHWSYGDEELKAENTCDCTGLNTEGTTNSAQFCTD